MQSPCPPNSQVASHVLRPAGGETLGASFLRRWKRHEYNDLLDARPHRLCGGNRWICHERLAPNLVDEGFSLEFLWPDAYSWATKSPCRCFSPPPTSVIGVPGGESGTKFKTVFLNV